ncbi:prepilin-type processing-associated H-X9-DG domain-containing protein [Candidatus Fervidibacteria bacterium JGI MDM2 JNZ-1-D12]
MRSILTLEGRGLKMKWSKGLTLTELLVVIAFLALLFGLLLAVLPTIRSKSRQAICASNLRQLAFAMKLYTKDYDGWFSFLWRYYEWPSVLTPYLGLQGLPFLKLRWDRPRIHTGIYQCPEQPESVRHKFLGYELWDQYPTVSYAINMVYDDPCTCLMSTKGEPSLVRFGGYVGSVNICGPVFQNWEWLIDDSSIVLFVDRSMKALTLDESFLQWPYVGWTLHYIEKVPYIVSHVPCLPSPPIDEDIGYGLPTSLFTFAFGSPHQGGTNTAFVDGHVKWMLPDKLNERTSTGLLKWWISFKIP